VVYLDGLLDHTLKILTGARPVERPVRRQQAVPHDQMPQPRTVQLAVLTFVVAAAVGAVNCYLQLRFMNKFLAGNGGVAEVVIYWCAIAATYFISVHAIWHRRSWGRVLMVAILCLSLPGYFAESGIWYLSAFGLFVSSIQSALVLLGAIISFAPSSNAWFRSSACELSPNRALDPSRPPVA
jgi:hypothetical protein